MCHIRVEKTECSRVEAQVCARRRILESFYHRKCLERQVKSHTNLLLQNDFMETWEAEGSRMWEQVRAR